MSRIPPPSSTATARPSTSRTPLQSSLKRDSLAAELERDPQFSAAKRQQRKNALNAQMTQSMLERELSTLKSSRAELEAKLRDRDSTIDKLKKDKRFHADREKEERTERERERHEYEAARGTSDLEIRTLRSKLQTVQTQHDDLQDDHSQLSRRSEHSISSLKAQLSTFTNQLSQLQHNLDQSYSQASEQANLITSLQDQVDSLTEERDRLVGSRNEEQNMGVVRDELQKQTKYIRTLESKNVKLNTEVTNLRERMTSIEVLREEKRSLERKLVGVEQLRSTVVALEAQVEAATREREDWASRSSVGSSSSSAQALSDLRLEQAVLLEEHGITSAQLHQRTIELEHAEKREAEAKESATELQSQIQTLKQTIDRRNRSKTMDEREIQFLKALIASYRAEESAAATPVKTEADPNDSRIQELEAVLSDYKEQNKNLSSQLDAKENSTLSAFSNSRSVRQEELAQERAKREAAEAGLESAKKEAGILEKTIATHESTIDKLEQTLFELSGEVAGGRHVPPNTRILCMKDNPEQQWFDLRQEAMDKLKGENEALLKRLKDVEDAAGRSGGAVPGAVGMDGAAGEDLVPRKSWETECETRKKLEDELRQKEKRILRLKEIFQSKSSEFRNCVTSILGVKLAFYPNGNVRVTSIYDVNATFVFQPPSTSKSPGQDQSAKLQLVAQGELNPEDVTDLMGYWLGNEQCIPGFMGAMTLQCYENHKSGLVKGVEDVAG